MATALTPHGTARRQVGMHCGRTQVLGRAVAGLILLLASGPGIAVAADHPAYDSQQALAFSQAAIGRELGEHRLTAAAGDTVPLSGFRGKPLVISMIYTSCYHVCPTLTKSLAHAVRIGRDALGQDSFAVISVGFDTAVDTPARMAAYAREQGIDINDWRFLAADSAAVKALSDQIGFIFFPSTKGFDHLSQITVVAADGRIYRQVYGSAFTPPELVEPLKELVFGGSPGMPVRLSDWVNNLKLFCTVYDPTTGRYLFDYSILVSLVTGMISLALVIGFIVHAWRRHATGAGPSGPAPG